MRIIDEAVDVSKLAEKQVRFKAKKLLVLEDKIEECAPLFDESAEFIVVPNGFSLVDGNAELDEELIKALCKFDSTRGRLAVVFTKCDEDDEDGTTGKEFKQIIDGMNIEDLQTFEVSNLPELPLDLNKLNEWSVNSLDSDDLRANYIASQMNNLELKKAEAKKIIIAAAAAAAVIGATPIPFADAALLVPDQLAMTVAIINVYGIYEFAHISKEVVASLVISNLGKSIAGGLLKLIPAAGAIIGGAINATVASAITSALGYATSTICYNACKDIMNGKEVN